MYQENLDFHQLKKSLIHNFATSSSTAEAHNPKHKLFQQQFSGWHGSDSWNSD
jgi:hypothetical protein